MPPPKKMQTQKAKSAVGAAKLIDLDPDAWPKFEALIKSAAKMGHKPHYAPLQKKTRRKATP